MNHSEHGGIEILAIFLMLLGISTLGMAIHWLDHLEKCYRWLDHLPNQRQAIIEGDYHCLGKDWQSLPAEIDYGAAFQKSLDAPVLCYLEENLPEIGDFIRCE